jgi:hypothetical protein
MKKTILIPILFFVLSSSSQTKVGFLFGGNLITSIDEMKFLDNPVSIGTDIGVFLSYSLFNKKIEIETNVLFFSAIYNSRDNNSTFQFDDFNRSTIGIYKNTYDYGLKMPIILSYKIGRLKPLAGIFFNLSLSGERNFHSGMGDLTVGDTKFYSATEGTISKTGSGLLLGCDFTLTRKMDIRFSFSHSFKDYVSYHFLATVNEEPVVSEYMSTRINQWGLSLVYTPDWKHEKKKKEKSNRSFKDRLKEVYQ